jgi:biotin transport system substrate-specific component
MNETRLTTVLPATTSTPARAVAVVAGAAFVALGAQIAVPLPGTVVPFTLQVPAILIVGGLLGPRLGAASLAVYLTAGMAGWPVFAPVGPPGLARLLGPTGGYLLAAPAAAAVVGRWSSVPTLSRLAAAMVAGLLVIHLGGIAQLAILGGDLSAAFRFGSLPFLGVDLLKLLLAGLIVGKFGSRTRALL